MDSPLNIIVVEDHDDLRDMTVAALGKLGHKACGVDCAEALDEAMSAFRADILILDLNLPGEDGISLARRLRAAEPEIGIIMVTARTELREKMIGYHSGADLYLTKPTSSEELDAAIRALARRLRPSPLVQRQITLNPDTLQLHGLLAVVNLSYLECALLAGLARAAEYRLETWQLMEISGKSGEEFNKAALEAQIVRLRKKLEHAGAPAPTLKALRGIGYQLCQRIEIRRAGS